MSATARACPNCHTSLPSNAAYCFVCGTPTPAAIDRTTGEYVMPQTTGVTMAQMLPRLRAALGASYDLGERIGVGGFAEVYLARDVRLKREVAIKVTRPDFAVNAQMMLRFKREAETIAALRHPHIMPIYDIGEAEGLAYIVMPFIRGESLKSRLDAEGRLAPEKARAILLQAADALAAAHEAGVVHRDVKPDNIMLDRREDSVLLMDFGIAKAAEMGMEGPALTSTGLVVGTPHYMSPEQAAGERTVDARADQYALGVVGYRMLAGALPFDGPTVRAILAKQLVGAATPLADAAPDAPPALVAAIMRAMAKEPDDRYASVRDFATALRNDPSYAAEVLRGTDSGPRYTPGVSSEQPDRRAQPTRSRRPLMLGLIALGALGAAGAYLGTRPTTSVPTRSDAEIANGIPAATQPAPPAAPPIADTTAPSATPAPAASALPDSLRKRLAADSAIVRRAGNGLVFGTPAADSLVARVTRSNSRTCDRLATAQKWVEARTICAARAMLREPAAMRVMGLVSEHADSLAVAASWYDRASKSGDEQATLRLAELLDVGHGVAPDPTRATALLESAAGKGSVVAMRTLGTRAATGANGARRSESDAATWYQKAAAQGDALAMDSLGAFYSRGFGVKRNDDSAFAWWSRSAAKNDAGGLYGVGMSYFRGKGVAKKSDSIALDFMRKAAALGHPGAKFEIEKRQKR